MKLYRTLGTKIKELRESKGWSQLDLATKLGFQTDTAIYLIEKGERRLPLDKIKELSSLFQVAINDLLGEEHLNKESLDIRTALRAKNLGEHDIDKITEFIDFIKSKSDNQSNKTKI